jgi:hypothetical protein
MTAYQPERWHDMSVAVVGSVVNAWILLAEIHR